MIETVFDSESVPAADRFAWWHEMACRSVVRFWARTDGETDFRAALRLLDLGRLRVSWLTCPVMRMHRPPKLVRQSDPEMYILTFIRRGGFAVGQSRKDAAIGPREMLLGDTSLPSFGRITPDETGSAEGMLMQIPKTLLPLPAATLDRLAVTRLPAHDGLGALLRRYLEELIRDVARYSAADVARLSVITLDLFAAMCAHHLEADDALPPETRHRAMEARVHAFIQHHLGDPDLCAETIAAAHGISVRYLYRLFQDQGLTVAGWIRRRRLERCRHDLIDPTLRSRPIHAIATRWGFSSNAHFSRLFRATYGISPRDYRDYRDAGTETADRIAPASGEVLEPA